MGTNYYLRHGMCGCCGRYDETHICKSFHTWHAPAVWDDEAGEYQIEIATFAAWRTRLRDEVAAGGRIFDEYGKEVPLADFLERAKPDRQQYDFCREGGYEVDRIERGFTWLDADGYTFFAGEFS